MEKIRYGVIGIGGVGNAHIRSVLKNEQAQLVAVADINRSVLEEKAGALGVRGFTDYREMIGMGIIDAVSIAVPHHLLASVTGDCLDAGLHVLVEKPLANRMSEADRLLELARDKQLLLAVNYQYRSFRLYQLFKEMIDGGTIGNVMNMLWTWNEFRPASYYRRDPWRCTFAGAGGGVLMNQASHDLDLICWLFGRPRSVTALAVNQLHGVAVEDIVSASFIFENGAVGTFMFTMNQPKSYVIRRIAGDRGMIVVPDVQSLISDEAEKIYVGTYEDSLFSLSDAMESIHEQPRIRWKRVRLPYDEPLPVKLLNPRIVLGRLGLVRRRSRPFASEIVMDNFFRAINGDEKLISSASHARETLEVINALYLSAYRGKTVDLPLDPEEYDSFFRELAEGRIKTPKVFMPCRIS